MPKQADKPCSRVQSKELLERVESIRRADGYRREREEQEPAHVKKARQIIHDYDRQCSLKEAERRRQLAERISSVREVILFKSAAEALRAVDAFEKSLA